MNQFLLKEGEAVFHHDHRNCDAHGFFGEVTEEVFKDRKGYADDRRSSGCSEHGIERMFHPGLRAREGLLKDGSKLLVQRQRLVLS